MSHRSYSRERRAERRLEKDVRHLFRDEFGTFAFMTLHGLNCCRNRAGHALYVACAEAALMAAFRSAELLEDWRGVVLDGHDFVAHDLPCGCVLLAVDRS